MKLVLESTDVITDLDGVPCRIWKGTTPAGVPCLVFVHRVAVEETRNAEEFDRELRAELPLKARPVWPVDLAMEIARGES